MAAVTAAAAVKLAEGRDLGIVAATSARRAVESAPHRSRTDCRRNPGDDRRAASKATALKLDDVRAVCIAWADELVTRGASAATSRR